MINSNLGPILPRFKDIAGFLLKTAIPLIYHLNFGDVPLGTDWRLATNYRCNYFQSNPTYMTTNDQADRRTDGWRQKARQHMTAIPCHAHMCIENENNIHNSETPKLLQHNNCEYKSMDFCQSAAGRFNSLITDYRDSRDTSCSGHRFVTSLHRLNFMYWYA